MFKMKYHFTKLLFVVLGTLACFSFTSCSNSNSVDIKQTDINSISLVGEPEKRHYTNIEQNWDFSGLKVLITYEDSTTATVPLTDSKVSYDIWPLAPYKVNKEEVDLEFRQITYTTSEGKTIENKTSVKYKMSFELKSSTYIRTSGLINMAVIMIVFMSTLTFIVLFKVDRKRKK